MTDAATRRGSPVAGCPGTWRGSLASLRPCCGHPATKRKGKTVDNYLLSYLPYSDRLPYTTRRSGSYEETFETRGMAEARLAHLIEEERIEKAELYERAKGYVLGRKLIDTWQHRYLAVRLDNRHIGAGPATVIAHPANVREYIALATDRDGARDPSLRLWRGDAEIGARVRWQIICGTGRGTITEVDPDRAEDDS